MKPKNLLSRLVPVLLALALLPGCTLQEPQPTTAPAQTAEAAAQTTGSSAELTVYYIDVGQGDSTLLKSFLSFSSKFFILNHPGGIP